MRDTKSKMIMHLTCTYLNHNDLPGPSKAAMLANNTQGELPEANSCSLSKGLFSESPNQTKQQPPATQHHTSSLSQT